MLFGFDTANPHVATAALAVYAVYRSRDKARFKVTPEMWGTITGRVAAASERASSVWQFVTNLRSDPVMCCACINPRWLDIGLQGNISVMQVLDADGNTKYALQPAGTDLRNFGVSVFEQADQSAVLRILQDELDWVIAAVRDRLEREKPIEKQFDIDALEMM